METVLDWMAFYKYRRLRSTLGYVSPMQHEQRWHAAQCKKRLHNPWTKSRTKQWRGQSFAAVFLWLR